MQAIAATNTLQTIKTPRIGQLWKSQGGIYAGMVRHGNAQWHLIAAAGTFNKMRTAWGQYQTIPGEFSRWDGAHNTQLILSADRDNVAALFATLYTADGLQDFYWPAEFETHLLTMNLPEITEGRAHWSSTQRSGWTALAANFSNGLHRPDLKTGHAIITPVRRIPIN